MGCKLCKANYVRAHTCSPTRYKYTPTYVVANEDQAITLLTVAQEKRVWNVDWDTTYPDLFIAGFPHSLQSNTETAPHLGHYLFLVYLFVTQFFNSYILNILRASLKKPQIDK